MRNSQRKDTQEGEQKVRCSNGLKLTIIKLCSDMSKVVSKEFQAPLRIRRKALPLSSAKDEMLLRHLQPRRAGLRQVTNKLLPSPKRLLTR